LRREEIEMSLQVPVRYPSGVSTAYPKELLGFYSKPNPLMSHNLEDDFDWLGATGVKYTITAAGGSVAMAAGDGGRVLFTTAAGASSIASIQSVTAGFAPLLGKRIFWAARVQLSHIDSSQSALGLMQTSATPGTVTDGIMFERAAAATTWTLKHYVGSVATLTLTMPATFVPVLNADFDIGFMVTEKGYLYGFGCTVANGGLFGYQPQSSLASDRGALVGGQIPTLTAVALNPTLAVIAGAGGAETMNADFVLASQERSI
jgi:hypothetical protein